MKIALIGGGRMGRALLGGLKRGGFALAEVVVVEPDPAQAAALGRDFGVAVANTPEGTCTDHDVIVLAVKPQILPEVAPRVAAAAGGRGLVLSIAAGVSLGALKGWMGRGPIVRAMPNTPATRGLGITALIANDETTAPQRRAAEQVVSALGEVLWLAREGDMDAVTAISGSGPAYFFLLMEALEAAAERLGLAPEIARRLVRQTAVGAADLAADPAVAASQLRADVTSPGGTTAAALEAFETGGFRALVATATAAAAHRSHELGETYR